MKIVRLLDSFALIKYFEAEPGGDRIRQYFDQAHRHQETLLICELNVGEVFYIIARKHGLSRAEEILTTLSTLPLKTIPVSWEVVLKAARLKAQHALSYADCIAAACAMNHQAVLLTGDPEFRAVKHLLRIEWV